jgi:O-methyltransferase
MSRLIGRLKESIPVRWREWLHRRLNRCRAAFLPEPYRTVFPYTMVGLPRLRTLDRLVRRVDEEGIPGDVVECGTCNGGTGAILARVACRSPLGRHTWLLDSFAGLPPAGPLDGAHAQAYTGRCHGATARVREVLGKVGVPDGSVTLVPGWFNETLPTFKAERIAVLHIDADWYDSVRVCLDHLYDRVSPGGFVVFDDYGYWEGCKLAWEEFRSRNALSIEVTDIDGVGAWFRKPVAAAQPLSPAPC